MKRAFLALALVAALALPAASSAAAAPTVTLELTGGPSEPVDGNRSGVLDVGDYQPISGALRIVATSASNRWFPIGTQGLLKGRIGFVAEGLMSVRVIAALPTGNIVLQGVASVENDEPFTLQAVGISGIFFRGSAQVTPQEEGGTIVVSLG